MLQVSRLSKTFGEAVAVDGLTFVVDEGEVVALMGPNGSGKTTTFRCILGLLNFEGEISVAGLDVRRHGREVRRLVGYMPQSPAFHDDLTVRETITYYARLRGLTPAETVDAAVASGIEAFAHRRAGGLSGGMRQRLALAVVLLGDPPLLLLDEPITSLDVDSRRRFADVLAALKARRRTVLVATHSVARLQPFLTGVVVMAEGRKVFQGAPEEMPGELLEEPLVSGDGRGPGSRARLEATP